MFQKVNLLIAEFGDFLGACMEGSLSCRACYDKSAVAHPMDRLLNLFFTTNTE